MVKQKLEENRRVFEGGWLEKKTVEKLTEAERTAAEHNRDFPKEREQVEVPEQGRSAEALFEPDEGIVEQEEQELFEPMAPLEGETERIREISDELERLAQRYGGGMEEWLYDQSSI